MRNFYVTGLVGAFLFLGACASYSIDHAEKDEKVDIFLSTLDDKHFVWCKLDLEQCQKDYEKWKQTPRGQTIMREYEKEETGLTSKTQNVTNVFRTRFVEESQFVEEIGKQESLGVSQDSDLRGITGSSVNENSVSVFEGLSLSPQIFGPEALSGN